MAQSRLTSAQVVTTSVRGRLTDASIESGSKRGRLTDAAVQTTAARGRLTDALVTSGSARGRLTDAITKTAPARGRLTDSIVQAPSIVGYYGQSGIWVPVRGFLGVAGEWKPVKWWTGATIPEPEPEPETRFPVRYASLAEARDALAAPTDASYVTWDPTWTSQGLMLGEVFSTRLGANDILVLPERAQPYEIDSSNGFMAAGVDWITGQLPNDSQSTRIRIIRNSRCWFEMARGRRGIIGLGPDVVIQPSASSFTRPPQPITQDTGGTMAAYAENTTGVHTKLQDLVGAQDALMRFDHNGAFCGNFTLRGRDFGGVAYSGMFVPNAVNIFCDAASRGHAGVPNGETGSIATNNVVVRYENIDFKTTDANGNRVVTSPLMLNRNSGGTLRNINVGRPSAGMLTFWRTTGTYTFENVHLDGAAVAINLEEGGPIVINWTGGSITTQGQYHIVGESSGGSKKITLSGVQVAGGRDAGIGALAAHFYSYTGTTVQKTSDIVRINPTGLVRGYGNMT